MRAVRSLEISSRGSGMRAKDGGFFLGDGCRCAAVAALSGEVLGSFWRAIAVGAKLLGDSRTKLLVAPPI